MSDTRTITGIEYEVIEEFSESGLCYEWHDAAVLRDVNTQQLYYVSASGCSCDWLWERIDSVQDMTPVASLAEAIELAKEEFSDSDVFEFAKRLRF